VRMLADHPDVAVTIDSNEWPYGLLSLRGTATATVLGEFFPEYVAMARRYLGDEGAQQFRAQARQTFSHWTRITIRPEEVRILDSEARSPSAGRGGQWGGRGDGAGVHRPPVPRTKSVVRQLIAMRTRISGLQMHCPVRRGDSRIAPTTNGHP